jgi:hypothetical protein
MLEEPEDFISVPRQQRRAEHVQIGKHPRTPYYVFCTYCN